MDSRSKKRTQAIQEQVKLRDGVWDTTWDAAKATERCNKIDVKKISPTLDSSASADVEFRPVLYVSYAVAFRSEEES